QRVALRSDARKGHAVQFELVGRRDFHERLGQKDRVASRQPVMERAVPPLIEAIEFVQIDIASQVAPVAAVEPGAWSVERELAGRLDYQHRGALRGRLRGQLRG